MKTLKHLFSKLPVPQRSRSAPGQPVLVRLSVCFFAIGLLVPAAVRAATAPPATLMYTASGPVHGGVATIGTSGVTYFTALSANGNPAKVIALNANGTEKWPPFTPGADMYAIPALDAAGAKLYIGSDAGIFYCRNTSDGSTPAGWTDFTVTNGMDKRIRSGAALDPNNPLGPTVYFHCNNGYLYALNAATGAQRWRAHTGNEGGPPVVTYFLPNPVSSSPVVDSSGVVYVGSADGSVYSFNPSTGAQNWSVSLGKPIEATLAIGQNGWLYVATRSIENIQVAGIVAAVNPVTHTVQWQVVGSDNGIGYVASPVIDQSGFVYAAVFGGIGGHEVRKFDPNVGSRLQTWTLPGKLCQTPSINQNGLLILGVSAFEGGEINEIAAINIGDPISSEPYWTITQVGGQNLGNTLGSPAILCTSSGRTYVADMLGKVFRFDTGAPMMAGQWPTFQCGNRRAGKSITYPSAIAELPPFTFSDSSFTQVSRVDLFGRAVGQSYGYYEYACNAGSSISSVAALWKNNAITLPGGCPPNNMADTYAFGLNGIGDVCGYKSSSPSYPIAWPDGANSSVSWTQLSTPGFTNGQSRAINASSTIIGHAFSGGSVHVFRWQKSGSSWLPPDLLNAPSGDQAYALSITDDGRIAGEAKFTAGGPFHAFNTSQFPTDLSFEANDMGTMGGTASEAWGMHELKGTVGRSQLSTGYWRAFLLPISAPNLGGSAIYQICGLPGVTRTDWTSAAYGVNKFGQVVGYSQTQQGTNLFDRAVLYSDVTGITADLNTYPLDGGQTPASLGWTLTSAVSISDASVMVGYGSISGRYTCWIIYPKCQD